MKIDDQNYVDEAEKVIRVLMNKKDRNGKSVAMVTTSKLRNLLAMSADIYNEVMNQNDDQLSSDICSRIEYLRVRFLYEAGREDTVRDFVNDSHIIEVLKGVNKSKKNYILFNRYMEALVAFRKYLGGKDE